MAASLQGSVHLLDKLLSVPRDLFFRRIVPLGEAARGPQEVT
jgi:hypothetical protein